MADSVNWAGFWRRGLALFGLWWGHAFIASWQPGRFGFSSCKRICNALHCLLDNIFIRIGFRLCGRIVGVPVGAGCSPLVAGLFFIFLRERLHVVSF